MEDESREIGQPVGERIKTGHEVGETGRSETEALQESKERFRTIFDSVNDAIFIHDLRTGAILDVNQRVCEMFGFTREEALRLRNTDLGSGEPPYTEEDALNWIHKAAAGEPQIFEWHAKHKTGRLFWVEVNMKRATISDKEHLLVSVRDITYRKKAEADLRESERRYRGLFETVRDGFASVNMDRMIVETNPAFQAMVGYTREELSGLSYNRLTPEKWHVFEEQIIREQVLSRGYSAVYEKEYVRKDGTIFPVEIRAHLLRDENGNPMEMWGFVRDIGGRKESERILQESEEKFRLLFEKSASAALLLDRDVFIDCNEAALKIMHCSGKEQLIGLHPFDISPERQPDSRLSSEKAKELIDITLREGVGHFEWVHRNLSGEEFWNDVSLTVIPFQGKRIMYAVWRDITKRRKAEEELRKREEELKVKSSNLEESNTALKVLLRHREEDKKALEKSILANVKELVIPYVDKLKGSHLNETQETYLSILESSLNDVVSPFLQTMAASYARLTPTEIQIANLTRAGKTSKAISLLLGLSTRTVDTHKNNIRKKLDLSNKKINLQAYLRSL